MAIGSFITDGIVSRLAILGGSIGLVPVSLERTTSMVDGGTVSSLPASCVSDYFDMDLISSGGVLTPI